MLTSVKVAVTVMVTSDDPHHIPVKYEPIVPSGYKNDVIHIHHGKESGVSSIKTIYDDGQMIPEIQYYYGPYNFKININSKLTKIDS